MSAPTRYLVDTNILLRFLIGTPPHQANAARQLFSRAQAGEIVLDIEPIVVAETFYTMLSFYEVERQEAASLLDRLLRQNGIRIREASVVQGALQHLQSKNVAFADAYLATVAEGETLPVASFDKDFDKFPGVTRFEPSSR